MKQLEKLKTLSIRVRMFYAIECLQKALIEKQLMDKIMSEIVIFLKTYTSSVKLDVWEKIANEIAPSTIMDENENNRFNEYEYISESDAIKLKNEYSLLPCYITDLIDAVIEVGVTNLYGGTDEYSPLTYEAVLNVVNLLLTNNITPPTIKTLPNFLFSENDGWGRVF